MVAFCCYAHPPSQACGAIMAHIAIDVNTKPTWKLQCSANEASARCGNPPFYSANKRCCVTVLERVYLFVWLRLFHGYFFSFNVVDASFLESNTFVSYMLNHLQESLRYLCLGRY